jgi:hypothetical protein
MSGLWIGCYECGRDTRVPDIGTYTSRQTCADCKAERQARFERRNPPHVHAWEPMAPEDGPFDRCLGCNTARRRS